MIMLTYNLMGKDIHFVFIPLWINSFDKIGYDNWRFFNGDFNSVIIKMSWRLNWRDISDKLCIHDSTHVH